MITGQESVRLIELLTGQDSGGHPSDRLLADHIKANYELQQEAANDDTQDS
jgi:hypothetical protein